MKKEFEALQKAREIASAAETAWEKEPENTELEKAFDAAYTAEWSARRRLASAIRKFTGGQIEFKIAMKMTFNPKLETIIRAHYA